jgi:hypothetical protein
VGNETSYSQLAIGKIHVIVSLERDALVVAEKHRLRQKLDSLWKASESHRRIAEKR